MSEAHVLWNGLRFLNGGVAEPPVLGNSRLEAVLLGAMGQSTVAHGARVEKPRSAGEKTGEQVRVQPRPSSVARRRRRHPVVHVIRPPEQAIILLANLNDSKAVRQKLQGGRVMCADQRRRVDSEGLDSLCDRLDLPLLMVHSPGREGSEPPEGHCSRRQLTHQLPGGARSDQRIPNS